MESVVIRQNDRSGKRKEVTCYVYTLEEVKEKGIQPVKDWREAKEGDWCLTDGDPEPMVIQIIKRYGDILYTCRGKFDSNRERERLDSQPRADRFSWVCSGLARG